jgi:hypothetical protein
MAKKNTMTPYTSKLQGFEDANDMPGTLQWSVGYYEKAALNQDLKKGASPNVPPAVKDDKGKAAQEAGTVADTKDEKDALRIPPDADVPSGVLSIIVHQINNLERQGACHGSGLAQAAHRAQTSRAARATARAGAGRTCPSRRRRARTCRTATASSS